MKISKTASGKQEVRISKSEWEAIGKKAGWDESWQSEESRLKQQQCGYCESFGCKGECTLPELEAELNKLYVIQKDIEGVGNRDVAQALLERALPEGIYGETPSWGLLNRLIEETEANIAHIKG